MKKDEESVASRKTPLVRGKYANLLERGSNVVILDEDIADFFPDSESVNNALRAYLAFQSVVERLSRRGASNKRELAFDPRTGSRADQSEDC